MSCSLARNYPQALRNPSRTLEHSFGILNAQYWDDLFFHLGGIATLIGPLFLLRDVTLCRKQAITVTTPVWGIVG